MSKWHDVPDRSLMKVETKHKTPLRKSRLLLLTCNRLPEAWKFRSKATWKRVMGKG